MLKSNKVIKKYWSTSSKDGEKLEFLPIFEVNEESGEVEARIIELSFTDRSGKKKKMSFNYLDIYMFIYFTANEELRRQLIQRYERKINNIPYDVTIKLSEAEKQQGVAHRRVELPVDELAMAIARNDAAKIALNGKIRSTRNY